MTLLALPGTAPRACRRVTLLAALTASTIATAPLDAQIPGAVPAKEWKVPWEKTRPRDPAVHPDGRIFFVGQEGNYLASLDPRTGQFRRYAIDEGTHPHNCVVDARGQVWYAGNRNAMIGRLNPTTGEITRYPMPDSTVRDPHTLIFDRNGDLWFTAQFAGVVGRLEVRTGKISIVRMPERGWRPYGIVIDAANRPVFDLFGTNKIGTIDPATMTLKTYPLPNDRARPRRIGLTTDGTIWYGDYTRGALGRIDPKTGEVVEYPLPGGPVSLPYAMTVDDKDRIWFVETGKQPNRLIGFDPKSKSFFGHTDIESGGGTIRHMVFDKKTGQIWFGTDNGTIGRAVVSGVRPAL
jgi:virginiamycin B lyase